MNPNETQPSLAQADINNSAGNLSQPISAATSTQSVSEPAATINSPEHHFAAGMPPAPASPPAAEPTLQTEAIQPGPKPAGSPAPATSSVDVKPSQISPDVNPTSPAIANQTDPGNPANPIADVPTDAIAPADLPPEVHRWNWGAFVFTWIWGISHKVKIAYLGLIPIVNFAVMVYLGVKGGELSWKNRRFENIDQYKIVEKKWALFAWIVLGLIIALTILGFIMAYRQATQVPPITPIELN